MTAEWATVSKRFLSSTSFDILEVGSVLDVMQSVIQYDDRGDREQ